MNVVVNPKDHVVFLTDDKVPKGVVIIEVESGYYYISNERQPLFLPRSEAEQFAKREQVRRLFGLE